MLTPLLLSLVLNADAGAPATLRVEGPESQHREVTAAELAVTADGGVPASSAAGLFAALKLPALPAAACVTVHITPITGAPAEKHLRINELQSLQVSPADTQVMRWVWPTARPTPGAPTGLYCRPSWNQDYVECLEITQTAAGLQLVARSADVAKRESAVTLSLRQGGYAWRTERTDGHGARKKLAFIEWLLAVDGVTAQVSAGRVVGTWQGDWAVTYGEPSDCPYVRIGDR